MNPRPVDADGAPSLVPDELRGYRRFRLAGGNLMPTVYVAVGPWDALDEHAVCADGSEHAVPARDCGCGLYGWYHPSRATSASGFGDVTAVIAARGRTILGEHGFRSAGARIEAVAVPARSHAVPGAARRARRSIAERYPYTAVYRSRRRMLRDHPPADLAGLGISVSAAASPHRRRRVVAVWAVGLVVLCTVAAVLSGALARAEPLAWASTLGVLLVWQALLIRMVGRYWSGGTRARR